MGKYRFKFSDMIPNAWFYKLKDMSKTRSNQQHYKKKQHRQQQQQQQKQPHISLPRYSYYFNSDNKFYASPVNPKASDTHYVQADPSRRSSRKRRTVYKPSPRHFSAACNCHPTTVDPSFVWSPHSPDYYCISSTESCSLDLDFPESDSELEPEDEKFVVTDDESCNCEVNSSTTDIIFDLNNDEYCEKQLAEVDEISELELPPILTKPGKTTQDQLSKAHPSLSVKIVKEENVFRTHTDENQKDQRTRKSSTGIRLRANSPRIASKKIQAHASARKSISSSKSSWNKRLSISESFVVVKSSVDPEKDFRESMVEMIVENNLQTSKDLEHLLACYLSLNSNEYHHLIVKAFEQVWFDMTTNLRM
ncbi:Transcription repressor like [Melia azedarach]|uniref:Transcription repressor like n=1 Tax=Melia azedarach TaxID=155640 RepID=A0ACC1Y6Q7_MELAZ|nr:Transcription repressor like [Melia azedarach]